MTLTTHGPRIFSAAPIGTRFLTLSNHFLSLLLSTPSPPQQPHDASRVGVIILHAGLGILGTEVNEQETPSWETDSRCIHTHLQCQVLPVAQVASAQHSEGGASASQKEGDAPGKCVTGENE